MQRSERQWRIEPAGASGPRRGDRRGSGSKPRAVKVAGSADTETVCQQRRRLAGSCNAGRSPKHRTSQEVRQQVVMLHQAARPVGAALREEGLQEPHRASPRRVIDIPKRPDAARATYSGKEVVVKHLLSGDYRVFHGEEGIAWPAALDRSLQQAVAKTTTRTKNWGDTFTEQLGGDIFTSPCHFCRFFLTS